MRTILIADDNDNSRALARVVLEHAGYAVMEASNGAEAVSAAKANEPDLIVLDLRMPELTGFEVLTILRSDPRFAATPVIAATAFAMEGDSATALAAGFTAYIAKPFRLAEFRELVAGLLM